MKSEGKTITLERGEIEVIILRKGVVTRRIYLHPTKATAKRIQRIYAASVYNAGCGYLGLSDQNYTMIWRRNGKRQVETRRSKAKVPKRGDRVS